MLVTNVFCALQMSGEEDLCLEMVLTMIHKGTWFTSELAADS